MLQKRPWRGTLSGDDPSSLFAVANGQNRPPTGLKAVYEISIQGAFCYEILKLFRFWRFVFQEKGSDLDHKFLDNEIPILQSAGCDALDKIIVARVIDTAKQGYLSVMLHLGKVRLLGKIMIEQLK